MTQSHHVCVRNAIAGLTSVQQALSGGANAVLREKISWIIQQLEEIEAEERVDPGKIVEVLKVIGDGLALAPVIVELMQKFIR